MPFQLLIDEENIFFILTGLDGSIHNVTFSRTNFKYLIDCLFRTFKVLIQINDRD